MSMKIVIIVSVLFSLNTYAGIKVKIESLPNSRQNSLESCDPNPGSCRVVDQSGSIEPWECRNSTSGNIRCYADVEYGNGTRLRIWGGCYGSFSDCWSTGAGGVDACD